MPTYIANHPFHQRTQLYNLISITHTEITFANNAINANSVCLCYCFHDNMGQCQFQLSKMPKCIEKTSFVLGNTLECVNKASKLGKL